MDFSISFHCRTSLVLPWLQDNNVILSLVIVCLALGPTIIDAAQVFSCRRDAKYSTAPSMGCVVLPFVQNYILFLSVLKIIQFVLHYPVM